MARLLVVEDEPDLRDLLVQRLQGAGHKVVALASGPAALEAVERDGPPDAAVLDVDLPGMNGLDLLSALREFRPGLPGLFVTVLWSGELLATVKASGSPWLSKPFTGPELRAAIDDLLGTAAGAAPG
jgi:two-component system OmpR family response regulator